MKIEKLLFSLALLFSFSLQASNSASKRVVKIIAQHAEYTYSYAIGYDSKSRIISVTPDHSEDFGITRCEYGTDTFRIYKGDTYTSCILNKQGYIISSQDGYFPVYLIGEMSYNNKGQLTTIEYPEFGTARFLWKNDNLVKMDFGTEEIDIVYTTLQNKNNLGFLLTIEEINRTAVFPYYALLGKQTKNLPASIGQDEQLISYEYKTDKDGFITEITTKSPNNAKTVRYLFTYE